MNPTSPPVHTSKLRYRLFREGDLPGLRRLWDSVGWSPDQNWPDWYLSRHTGGQPLIAVALDAANDIVAQLEFQQSSVQLASEVARAVRLSAAILRKDLRAHRIDSVSHPILQLFRLGSAEAAARGSRVLYGFPHAHWLPILRKSPQLGLARFEILTVACWAGSIECGDTRTTAGAALARSPVIARVVDEFGADHEVLWRDAREGLPIECGVVRSAARLNARRQGTTSIEVRHAPSSRLIGYCTLRRRDGLLLDLLAGTQPALETVLAGVVQFVCSERARVVDETVRALKVMGWPVLKPALRSQAFVEESYRFAFACASLDPTLPAKAMSAERWYVAPGD
jgi:hypothetical protein